MPSGVTEPTLSPGIAPAPGRSYPGQGFSLLQFLFSLLTVLVCGGIGLLLVLMGLSDGLPSGLSTLTMAGAAVWLGVLLIPSVISSFLRLTGNPIRSDFLSERGLRLAGLAIFLFPVALFLGNWTLHQEGSAGLAFPLLHILATSLPVAWIIYLAVRGLPLASPQRAWGVFGTGLVLGPAIALTLETIVLIAAFSVVIIVILSQPGLMEEFSSLFSLLEAAPQTPPEPQVILEILGPYLTQPFVIVGTLVFASLLVPLIEEAFKPIGVWLLMGHRISPAAGFAAGALSGAGFALFENLLLTASTDTWTILQVARIGTSAVHILATALVGYALTTAWQQRRYGQLIWVYLGAVVLHGAWNAFSMIMTFGDIHRSLAVSNEPAWLANLAEMAPYAMGALALGSLSALIIINAHLRRDQDATSTITSSQ